MVDGQVYTAEHLLLATGGFPAIPPLPGAELGITSDGFFDLKQQPRSVLVVGAGYIAVEMAQILATLGTKTTLACRSLNRVGFVKLTIVLSTKRSNSAAKL